jgi:NitT/TauT family transport system substrate-binding protein
MTNHSSRAQWLSYASGFAVALSTRGTANAQSASTLKIGISPREPMAQATYAQSQNLFIQRNLTATIQTLQSGAAVVAAVASGDLQIGCSNSVAIAQAHMHGLPVEVIAPAGIHDSHYPTTLCVVAASSSITSPKQLNGQVVAGASVGGLDQLAVSLLIDKSGGDATTVKFVEVPQPAMVAALTEGRIAAAHLSEPDLSAGGSRIRSIGDAEDALAPVFAQTAWFTTSTWLAQNKDVARRFAETMFAAGRWAMANPEQAALTLQTAFGAKEQRAVQRFATGFDPTAVRAVVDAGVKYKMLAPMNVADFVWNGR